MVNSVNDKFRYKDRGGNRGEEECKYKDINRNPRKIHTNTKREMEIQVKIDANTKR